MFAREILASVFVTLVLAGLTALPVAAQTPTPNEINAIAKELWCPLCNGVRLDNCELQACVQMREVIAQKLEAGESKEQIKAYFVQQYGDVVLGAPAGEGFNILVWVLPILVGLVAVGWLTFLVHSWVSRSRPATATAAAAGPAQVAPGDPPKDKYLKQVEDELKKYE
jgi:cytochrome c-type biogenesis protein CcmH